MIYIDTKGGNEMPEQQNKKIKSLRYLALQLASVERELTREEQAEMLEILKDLQLTHDEVISEGMKNLPTE